MKLEKPFEQYIGKWLIDSKREHRWKSFVLGINHVEHNKYDNRDTVYFKAFLFRKNGAKLVGWMGERETLEGGESVSLYSPSSEDFHIVIKLCFKGSHEE